MWCRGRESNSHFRRNRILNPARLPIPPPRQFLSYLHISQTLLNPARSLENMFLTFSTEYIHIFVSDILSFMTLVLPAHRLPIPPPRQFLSYLHISQTLLNPARSLENMFLTFSTEYIHIFVSDVLSFVTLVLPAHRLPIPPSPASKQVRKYM